MPVIWKSLSYHWHITGIWVAFSTRFHLTGICLAYASLMLFHENVIWLGYTWHIHQAYACHMSDICFKNKILPAAESSCQWLPVGCSCTGHTGFRLQGCLIISTARGCPTGHQSVRVLPGGCHWLMQWWRDGRPVTPLPHGNSLALSFFLCAPFGSGSLVLLRLAWRRSSWSDDLKFEWHTTEMLASDENRKKSIFYLQKECTGSRACL